MKDDLRIKVKILKATLKRSNTNYASDALDYINILEKQLTIPVVGVTEGESCKCGNKTFTHRHTNWIECTACNKIKVLQD